MSGLAIVHIVCLGLWGGVVLVELLFELDGARGRIPHDAAARLHRKVDRWIELPILSAVTITGLLLWSRTGWDATLLPKVSLGGGAVLANLLCWIVVERRADLQSADRDGHLRLTRLVFLSALVGVPLAAGALWLGGARAGWF